MNKPNEATVKKYANVILDVYAYLREHGGKIHGNEIRKICEKHHASQALGATLYFGGYFTRNKSIYSPLYQYSEIDIPKFLDTTRKWYREQAKKRMEKTLKNQSILQLPPPKEMVVGVAYSLSKEEMKQVTMAYINNADTFSIPITITEAMEKEITQNYLRKIGL